MCEVEPLGGPALKSALLSLPLFCSRGLPGTEEGPPCVATLPEDEPFWGPSTLGSFVSLGFRGLRLSDALEHGWSCLSPEEERDA